MPKCCAGTVQTHFAGCGKKCAPKNFPEKFSENFPKICTFSGNSAPGKRGVFFRSSNVKSSFFPCARKISVQNFSGHFWHFVKFAHFAKTQNSCVRNFKNERNFFAKKWRVLSFLYRAPGGEGGTRIFYTEFFSGPFLTPILARIFRNFPVRGKKIFPEICKNREFFCTEFFSKNFQKKIFFIKKSEL